MGSNYMKMVLGARKIFLECDQSAMISRWGLESDADNLYLRFMGERMRVDRHTGEVASMETEGYIPDEYINESMVLFDLLAYPQGRPHASGRWASISTLGGIIGAGHDRTLSHEGTAVKFSGRIDALRAACERLGGVPMGRADVSCAVPVFEDFGIWFQFWDGDDEFPASIKYLFDENALRYMHYETLWYAMGCLEDRLEYYIEGGDGR